MAADDPVSPELILVSSPEEAERARSLLPPPPRFERPPPVVAAPLSADPPPRRSRTWLLAVAAALVLAVVGAGLWAKLSPSSTKPEAAAPPHPRVATPTTAPVPVPAPAVKPTTTAPARAAVTTAPAATTSRTTRTTTTTSQAAAFVPARVWLWQRAPGVTRYLFELTLNGKRVVLARTTSPRYALPKSFRFRAGTYRWTVRPLPLTKAPPLTDSRFVVTAESAVLANR